MPRNERVLGVITARGQSKGVARKNLRVVGGRPLIAWTIAAAREARHIDRVILSSDDEEIIATAERLGCEAPFRRAAELATDEAPSIDVVLDALQRCPGYDWVVLLQPTSPLRTADDIDGAILRCREAAAPACVSVAPVAEHPWWMVMLADGGQLRPLLPQDAAATRRQDLPAVYSLNGAVYVARTDWLAERRSFVQPETVAYVMPAERSLDIDTEADLLHLQSLLPSP